MALTRAISFPDQYAGSGRQEHGRHGFAGARGTIAVGVSATSPSPVRGQPVILKLLAVATAALLATCAPIHYDLQPGQTRADFAADSAKCQLVAQAMYAGGTGLLGAIGAVTIPRRDYRLCMQALGYTEASEAQSSSGTNSAIQEATSRNFARAPVPSETTVPRGVDCSFSPSLPWPPPPDATAPDVMLLALAAQRDAAAGEGAAQWLLGSLYLNGLGVPRDRAAGTKWIETAAHSTWVVIAPSKGSLSELELTGMMFDTAEGALPQLVQQYGAAWGIALYKQNARLLLQALSGCNDYSSRSPARQGPERGRPHH